MPPRSRSGFCTVCCTTSCVFRACFCSSTCARPAAGAIFSGCFSSRSAIFCISSSARGWRACSSSSPGTGVCADLCLSARFAAFSSITTRSGGCSSPWSRRLPPPCGGLSAPRAVCCCGRLPPRRGGCGRRHKKSQNLLQAGRALGIIERKKNETGDGGALRHSSGWRAVRSSARTG